MDKKPEEYENIIEENNGKSKTPQTEAEESPRSEEVEMIQTERKGEIAFKKPTLLIGKRGRFPRKLQTISTSVRTENATENSATNKPENIEVKVVEPSPKAITKDKKTPQQQLSEQLIPLPYKEPSWSGLPDTSGKPYVFEVLKNGTIIETIDLMKKPFYAFGRLATCEICMQHPTISRYHAVLQYRDTPSETDPPGFYIYDLGSTHGTFLNGKNNKLKPRVYAPMRVGHMLRLGCSQRSYILTGPEDDQEEESELSVTELKQLRDQKIREHEDKMRQAELENEEKRKREEERGVDWGLGDDADESEDLTENPYASTTNEELYLDDPKKALRGFFEREGLELEYDCTEQGLGQFLCKVELPLDDEMGKPIVAEVLHRGKKKEAVVQCALEACRILDRFGVLRQATHESRKRKTKNWEENDYYDSDDDTFLDRTGAIEKKREKRMKVKEPEKVETYESLLEKERQLSVQISEIEKRLSIAQQKLEDNGSANADEDSLDSYMKGLQEHKTDRQTIAKLKFEIVKLKKEHANIIRLANIAKPADLPALVPQTANSGPSTSTGKAKQVKAGLPIFGKRKTNSVKFPLKPSDNEIVSASSDATEKCEEEPEEEAEDVETNEKLSKQNVNTIIAEVDMKDVEEDDQTDVSNNETSSKNINFKQNDTRSSDDVSKLNVSEDVEKADNETKPEANSHLEDATSNNDPDSSPNADDNPNANSDSGSESEDAGAETRRAGAELLGLRPIKSFHDTLTFRKFENIMRTGLPPFAGKHKEKLEKILHKLKRLASNEDRMHVDWKTLTAKKRKVMKLITDLRYSETNEKLEYRVSSELNRILSELNVMTEEKFKVIGKVKKMGNELRNISIEIDKDIKALRHGMVTKEDQSNKDDRFNTSEPGPSTENSETSDTRDDSSEVDDKKKKKNQKRIEQRLKKEELERQRGYEEDATRENYSMWVPPSNQSGDGRTSLNDKYGY